MRMLSSEKPFGLTIVLDANGNAQGDLFSDDGESIDTIGSKAYFYATYKWSSRDRQLQINVAENSYSQMANLILDSLTIYGLDETLSTITVGGKELHPTTRPQTQITDVIGLGLPMDKSHTVSWTGSGTTVVIPPEALTTNPKYRVDCHPDPGQFHSISLSD